MQYLIYGAGLLGEQVGFQLEQNSKKKVIGFIDDTLPVGKQIVNNKLVLGSFESITNNPIYSPENVEIYLAIGYSNMKARGEVLNNIKKYGYKIASFFHPKSIIEKKVQIEDGVIIMAGVIIDQNSVIKSSNYLDIGVKVGENVILNENNYVSAGATIGGNVNIGKNNFLGLNCTIINNIFIGNNNFINSMSLVHKNIKNDCKYVELKETRVLPYK